MKLFYPVEKMPTETLLKALGDFIGAAFGLGFFIGACVFILAAHQPADFRQTAITAFAFIFFLGFFLVLHLRIRWKIIPELKKRIGALHTP